MTANIPVPSVDDSPALKLLPCVLSMVAGSADVVTFLGLGGLFVAHITGNLVILAATVVTGDPVGLAPALSVPVFIVVLGFARLLATGLQAAGFASLLALLGLQFALLAGSLLVIVFASPSVTPDARGGVLAGMLAVGAMAVQNALAQVSLRGAPTTAVMTTNVTRFTMDVVTVLLNRPPTDEVAQARRRAARTWPAILGFAAGAAFGAALFRAAGLLSLALPTGLALLTLACGGHCKSTI
jgi:uncharacterized membrane protein YoaK (UPF0700 family)